MEQRRIHKILAVAAIRSTNSDMDVRITYFMDILSVAKLTMSEIMLKRVCFASGPSDQCLFFTVR